MDTTKADIVIQSNETRARKARLAERRDIGAPLRDLQNQRKLYRGLIRTSAYPSMVQFYEEKLQECEDIYLRRIRKKANEEV